MSVQTEQDVLITIHGRSFRRIIGESDIRDRIIEMADAIDQELFDEDPLLVPVLNGAFIFAADLARQLSFDPEIQFVKFNSYKGTQSTGTVNELIGLNNRDLSGRRILIVEDIVDSGGTLEVLLQHLKKHGAGRVSIATLLFKPGSYKLTIPVEYVGFEVDEAFVVGYGLDFDGIGRSLKSIYQAVDMQ